MTMNLSEMDERGTEDASSVVECEESNSKVGDRDDAVTDRARAYATLHAERAHEALWGAELRVLRGQFQRIAGLIKRIGVIQVGECSSGPRDRKGID